MVAVCARNAGAFKMSSCDKMAGDENVVLSLPANKGTTSTMPLKDFFGEEGEESDNFSKPMPAMGDDDR